MTVQQLKQRSLEAIDAHRREIVGLARELARCPELGFKEHSTSAMVERALRGCGLEPRTGLAITGLKAVAVGRHPVPRVAVLGELDAVVCPGHPQANGETGAAHACGHHGQLAAMVGVAIGLVKSQVIDELDGSVAFMAVPAEEYVEIEYRYALRQQGIISFLGGKQELIARGEFDDVDLAMMVHLSSLRDKRATVGGTSNGFIGKLVRYRGKEAHAGAAPHAGVNALNAALLGIMGIHCLRETFRDEDTVRVHPVITRGGDLVNIIPADVRLETYVRAKTVEAMLDANRKVNRALEAGAYAVGAEVTITELPGYLPRLNEPRLTAIFRTNLVELLGEDAVGEGGHAAGSSDMGDLMHLIPAIHPMIGGCEGTGHSDSFRVVDEELAYVVPAKAMALTCIDLLYDGAVKARRVLREYNPRYSKEGYLKMWEEVLRGRRDPSAGGGRE